MSVALTWWGASCVELAAADGRRLVVDPVGPLADARFHCICVTREDHDHFDPAALRRLTVGRTFERLLLPLACSALDRLSSPVAEGAADLSFVERERVTFVRRPRHVRHPRAAAPPAPPERPIEVAGFAIESFQSSVREPPSIIERWQRLRTDAEPSWPADEGPLVATGEFPPLGYVVTDRGSGVCVYHPGDLQEVFDAHRELRGRIDVLLLPLPATEGIELTLVDAVRPRVVVPIHHGAPPVDVRPRAVDRETGHPLPGAEPDAYRAELRALIAAGWHPSPADPLARIAQLRPSLERLGSTLRVAPVGAPMTLG